MQKNKKYLYGSDGKFIRSVNSDESFDSTGVGRIFETTDQNRTKLSSIYSSYEKTGVWTDIELNNSEDESYPFCDIAHEMFRNVGRTGNDNWYYQAIEGCGQYLFMEQVRQDKVRVFSTEGSAGPVHQSSSPFTAGSNLDSPIASGLFTRSSSNNSGNLYFESKSLTGDFYLGLHIYLSSNPTADQTIISKLDRVSGYTGPSSGMSGPTGGLSGGSGDTFKLWIDYPTNAVIFSYSEDSDGTSLANTITVGTINGVGTGGIFPREWEHIAVSYDTTSKEISTYVNGNRTNYQGVSGDGLKLNNYPFYVGSLSDGTEGYSGRIKDLIIRSGSTASSVLNGFTGSSISGATIEQGLTTGVLYYMPMNGIPGCKNFTVHSHDYGTANVSFWIKRKQILGLEDFSVYGNFDGFFINQGFIEGLSSGAMWLPGSTSGGGFTTNSLENATEGVKSRVRGEYSRQLNDFVLTGSSSEANFFPLLFGVTGASGATSGSGIVGTGPTGSSGHAGDSFSFTFNQDNYQYVQGIYSILIGSTGNTGNTYSVSDSNDKSFHFNQSEMVNLYGDLTTHLENVKGTRDQLISLANTVDGATTIGNVMGTYNETIYTKPRVYTKFDLLPDWST